MTTTHDHAIETLPDGRRVCFECDVDATTIARVLRHLGQRGGRARTAAKAEAARLNGRKGGRPKKAKPDA
jgi:hypothetical protein